MTNEKSVLVVGGTGALGGQVVSAVLSRGKRVRALVRPQSNAASLQLAGVEIVRGDMMDPASLLVAMEGVDAVITTAAGYTRHNAADTIDIDTIGNRNMVDAAAQIGVRRFVLTSVLTCDQTPQVPRFWHKKLVEDYLAKRGVPYVSLRPGAFLEGFNRKGRDPFKKGRLSWVGSASIPMTFVLASDLAGYLADAVDATGAEGQHIDIGWDRPMSIRELVGVVGEMLGHPISVRMIPGRVFDGISAAAGFLSPRVKDMHAMMRWFQTGRYVADPTRQLEVFGKVPSAEDAIGRFAARL